MSQITTGVGISPVMGDGAVAAGGGCAGGGCEDYGVTDWSYQETPAASNTWLAVCWSPELGLFATIAQSGNRAATSPDGLNWTIRSVPNSAWFAICWSPELGLFVAVANSGTNRVVTSPDGITWTARNAAAALNWRGVCWSPELGLFVAVAASGTGNRVMTSPDGINWTSRTSAADNGWTSVCWSPELGLFVAVAINGASNQVMTSLDGVTWTAQQAAAALVWNSVCWSPQRLRFVATGYVASGAATGAVMISVDGITWVRQTAPADNTNWGSVCWSPEMCLFVAVGSGPGVGLMTSPDGVNWTTRTPAVESTWQSVCWSPQLCMFVAVCNDGGENERIMINRSALFNQVNAAASDVQMSSIADDSGRAVTGGAVSDSGLLAPGSHSGGDEWSVGLQFDDEMPAQGATIAKATLTLWGAELYEDTDVAVYISAHLADTPTALNTNSGDLDAATRPRTVAYTVGELPNVDEFSLHSFDVTDVIQELVDQPGWTGTRIVIIMDTHEGTTAGEWQHLLDYGSEPDYAPGLRIDLG